MIPRNYHSTAPASQRRCFRQGLLIGDKYHDVLTAPGGLSHTADGMAEGPLHLIFMYLGKPVAGTVSPLDAMVIENLRNAGIKVLSV